MQKPQVFINFRGKDERKKLLPHLKYHLKASPSNLNVFTDDDAIGQPLQRLFKHIRNSRLVIVIFSVNYLESHWCLDELVEIRKCLKTEKIEFAVPIFYKVQATHVKEQSGEFGANFLTLKDEFPDKIKKWKKALGFVADYGGLTYEERSPLSELDFIKKVVRKVDGILAESASNQILERKAENSIAFEANYQSQLHLSKTLEALNLERSYFQGFMHGSAWKDLISSMKSTNRFEIPLPESSVQFPMNLQSFDAQAQRNESIERAINILALSMMRKQTQPALIFSNWDKLDHDTKNYIIYSAHKKSKIIKSYNGKLLLFSYPFTFKMRDLVSCFSENSINVTHSLSLSSSLSSSSSSCSKYNTSNACISPSLIPSIQTSITSIYRISLLTKHLIIKVTWCNKNNPSQFNNNNGLSISVSSADQNPLTSLKLNTSSRFFRKKKGNKSVSKQRCTCTNEMDWPVEPPVEPPGQAQGSNDNIGQTKVVVKRRDDNPGCFTSMCCCFKSCVCLT